MEQPEGVSGLVVVNEPLCSEDKSNYPLEREEWEVPVRGRVSNGKRTRATAWLQNGGKIRIDDPEHPAFWMEFELPPLYVADMHRQQEKVAAEREKRRRLYEELKKEFE